MKVLRLFSALALLGTVGWGVFIFKGGLHYFKIVQTGNLIFVHSNRVQLWAGMLGGVLVLVGVLVLFDPETRKKYKPPVRIPTAVLTYLLAIAAFWFAAWFAPSYRFGVETDGVRLRTWEGRLWIPWEKVTTFIQHSEPTPRGRRDRELEIRGREGTRMRIGLKFFRPEDLEAAVRLMKKRAPKATWLEADEPVSTPP